MYAFLLSDCNISKEIRGETHWYVQKLNIGIYKYFAIEHRSNSCIYYVYTISNWEVECQTRILGQVIC